MPNANAGRIRWRAALTNTSRRPTSSASRNRKPVTSGRRSPGSSRPVNGSACSATPKTKMNSTAHRNSGTDISSVVEVSATISARRSRNANSPSPPPMPRHAAIAIDTVASSSVAGSVSQISGSTGRRRWIERPEIAMQGTAEPDRVLLDDRTVEAISARIASISSRVAFGGIDMAAGSTGRRRSAVEQHHRDDEAGSGSPSAAGLQRSSACRAGRLMSRTLGVTLARHPHPGPLPQAGEGAGAVTSTPSSVQAPSRFRTA